MKLLDSIVIQHASGPRSIRLYQGDLTAIPESEAVDLLIVSSFPRIYAPTRGTLIGALDRMGISLVELSRDHSIGWASRWSSCRATKRMI